MHLLHHYNYYITIYAKIIDDTTISWLSSTRIDTNTTVEVMPHGGGYVKVNDLHRESRSCPRRANICPTTSMLINVKIALPNTD